MTFEVVDGIVAIDRLKDHYKHCIRLSASNKINPKNAFDLQLIDYMQDLVSSAEGGQLNFKIASSALDVGAKIYSNRVDCIQSEAQKVASSILMALDGQQQHQGNNKEDHTNNEDSIVDDNASDISATDRIEQTQAKKKRARSKNIKTVVDDEGQLDVKVEKVVASDTFLDSLTRDYDMSCPAAVTSYNASTQSQCLLAIQSSDIRGKTAVATVPSETSASDGNFIVSLLTKSVNFAQLCRSISSNSSISSCPRLEGFLFNDRTTKILGYNSNFDELSNEDGVFHESFKTNRGGANEFNPELYANDNDAGCGDDHFGDADSVAGDQDDPIPNLDKIASTKPTDYGYSHERHRLLKTWAGPHAWKALKAPATARKEAPKSTRKRVKLEQKPIDFEEKYDKNLEVMGDKEIRHSSDVVRRWKKPLLPQDHNLNEEYLRETFIHTFLRPEDTYHCMKTPADALKLVDADHDYSKSSNRENSVDDAPASPGGLGGFDDEHDDSEDEFRADPVVIGNEIALTQQNELEFSFAGEHLIEQPFTVAQVNIPFAKIAKKMDVRKLKRVMWDLLMPKDNTLTVTTTTTAPPPAINGTGGDGGEENGNSTLIAEGDATMTSDNHNHKADNTLVSPAPTEPSSVHLEFSSLYGELPTKVSSKMASDLSQPIAFVTLLHLANEKNLRLISKQDLKDFIIEQDEVIN